MPFLVAVAFFLQDKTAEETFKTIEERIENARTVRIRFSAESTVTDTRSGKETKTVTFGTLMFNRMGKLCFFVAQGTRGGIARAFVNLEEPRVTENLNHRSVLSVDPQTLRSNLSRAFARSGYPGVLDWLGDTADIPNRGPILNYPLPTKTTEGAAADHAEVSGFQFGVEGSEGKTLQYAASRKPSGAVCQITLVLDPTSLLPRKRRMASKAGDVSTVLVETYSQYRLNEDISNEAFWEAFGESAEGITLRRIEDTIERATSIRIQFSSDMALRWEGKEQKAHFAGELLLKTGNKLRLSVSAGVPGEQPRMTTEVSDGKGISGDTLRGVESKDPARLFGHYLKGAVARGGLIASGFLLGEFVIRDDLDIREQFTVGNVRAGPEEKEGSTLTYSLLASGQRAEVKIWYDPKDYKIRKRVLTVKAGGPESTFTETYDEFTLNADIPDEKFKLPEK